MSGEMRSFHEQDFYELLEIGHDATRDEIDAAYERLKGVFDSSSSATYMLFGDDESDSMRQMLEEAYNTLTDDLERERYDDKLGIQRSAHDSAQRQQHDSAQPTRATSVTSTTTPIVTAAIVDDSDVIETPAPPAPVVETRAPFVSPIKEIPPPQDNLVSSPPAREDENMEYSGGVLMRVRESKAVPLEAIAQRTKITMAHLRAIEANQYDKLPARVYVRGFVAQYAKFLGLNVERVCASYLAIYDRFVQAKTIS